MYPYYLLTWSGSHGLQNNIFLLVTPLSLSLSLYLSISLSAVAGACHVDVAASMS